MNLNELKRLALAAQEYNLEYESFNNTLLVNHSKTLDAYYMRKDLGFFLQAMSSSTILSLVSKLETCIEALEFYAARSQTHPLGGDRAKDTLKQIYKELEGL